MYTEQNLYPDISCGFTRISIHWLYIYISIIKYYTTFQKTQNLYTLKALCTLINYTKAGIMSKISRYTFVMRENDEIQRRYEMLREKYMCPDIDEVWKNYGISRTQYYHYLKRFRLYGVKGLFNKPARERLFWIDDIKREQVYQIIQEHRDKTDQEIANMLRRMGIVDTTQKTVWRVRRELTVCPREDIELKTLESSLRNIKPIRAVGKEEIFIDPNDNVQMRYEMLREVWIENRCVEQIAKNGVILK